MTSNFKTLRKKYDVKNFKISGVFDWDALNKHFKSLPATTAPAGYKCPNCSAGVFPAENQAGPVADALREKLKV